MKFDAARIGVMVATYCKTSNSLLNAYPQKLRININTDPTNIPTIIATTNTTMTDNRAVRGCPAPNSFETLVLRKSTHKSNKTVFQQLFRKFPFFFIIYYIFIHIFAYLTAPLSPKGIIHITPAVLRLGKTS